MGAKFSILTLRTPLAAALRVWTETNRPPTEAERAYVRAQARLAALALFQAERQCEKISEPDDEARCE